MSFYSKMNSFRCLYITLLERWRCCTATKESGYSAHQSSCINPSINLKQAPKLSTLPNHSGLLVLLPSHVLYIVQSVPVELDNRSGNRSFFKRTHCSVYLSQYLTNLMHKICFTISLVKIAPDDEHMCSKHVEAWNKTYCEKKFCASSCLNTELKILRCTVN